MQSRLQIDGVWYVVDEEGKLWRLIQSGDKTPNVKCGAWASSKDDWEAGKMDWWWVEGLFSQPSFVMTSDRFVWAVEA